MSSRICDKLIRRENREEAGNKYTYELTLREADEVAAFGLPLYSIRISMTRVEGDQRETNARDVFSNGEKACAFFDKLVRNLATPIDLVYILEDEIG